MSKQVPTQTAPFAKPQEPSEQSTAAVQLREQFEEIQTLKGEVSRLESERAASTSEALTTMTADRDALASEVKKLRDQLQVAIARIVLLEQNGAVIASGFQEHKDGSVTLPITVTCDLMPHMKEWALSSDKGIEEFLRDQIQESLQMTLGAY